MTDQAISPLRRRMIEDMTIRKFAPRPTRRRAKGQGLRCVSRPIARHGQQGRCAPLPAALGIERCAYAQDQQHCLGAAIFL